MTRLFRIAGLSALALAASVAAADAATIALVTINQQALFFNQINDGATEAAKTAGVDLVIFNANNEPAAQNDAIENCSAACTPLTALIAATTPAGSGSWL